VDAEGFLHAYPVDTHSQGCVRRVRARSRRHEERAPAQPQAAEPASRLRCRQEQCGSTDRANVRWHSVSGRATVTLGGNRISMVFCMIT